MQPAKKRPASARQNAYARLCAPLAKPGWISEGSVQDRGARGSSPCYAWTRKFKGKTVCVALSQEPYEWLKQAIANGRNVQKTLRQMQRLSREELFEAIPGPKRRKQLSQRVLGLA